LQAVPATQGFNWPCCCQNWSWAGSCTLPTLSTTLFRKRATSVK